jgi:hypothetical protein
MLSSMLRARRVRLSALTLMTAVAFGTLAACSDDPAGPSPATPGTYQLTSVQSLDGLTSSGSGLPITFVDDAGTTLRFNNGSLVLGADGEFDLILSVVLRDDAFDAGDLGKYTANGSTVSFASELDSYTFNGTTSGSTLTVSSYDVVGKQFELKLKRM